MKTKRRVIALLTDFGLSDHYVGTLKGVILSRAPHVTIVDIAHQVDPQNITQAAFLLWSAYRYFPKGTIFAAIVDPGVGSERKILCVQTEDYIFIAPDNGVLKYILSESKPKNIVAVTNERLFLTEVSSTFHGRDIFAPICARLANGLPLSKLGKRTKPQTQAEDFHTFDGSRDASKSGSVIHIDRFGNCITDLRLKNFSRNAKLRLEIGSRRSRNRSEKTVQNFFHTYSKSSSKSPFIVIGSSGLLEISIKNGNAARTLAVKFGTPVKIKMNYAIRRRKNF